MKIYDAIIMGIFLTLVILLAGCTGQSSSTSASTADKTPSLALTATEITGSILKVTVKDLSTVEGQFAVMVDFYDNNNVKVSTQTLRTPILSKGQSGAVKFIIPSDAKTYKVVAMAAIIGDTTYNVYFVDERVVPTPTPEPVYTPVKTIMEDTSKLASTTTLTLESKTDGRWIYTTGTATNTDSFRHVIIAFITYTSNGVKVGDTAIISSLPSGTTINVSGKGYNSDGFPSNTIASVVINQDRVAAT